MPGVVTFGPSAEKIECDGRFPRTFSFSFHSQVKKAAAEVEQVWHGCGAKVGLEIWRIEKFKVCLYLSFPSWFLTVNLWQLDVFTESWQWSYLGGLFVTTICLWRRVREMDSQLRVITQRVSSKRRFSPEAVFSWWQVELTTSSLVCSSSDERKNKRQRNSRQVQPMHMYPFEPSAISWSVSWSRSRYGSLLNGCMLAITTRYTDGRQRSCLSRLPQERKISASLARSTEGRQEVSRSLKNAMTETWEMTRGRSFCVHVWTLLQNTVRWNPKPSHHTNQLSRERHVHEAALQQIENKKRKNWKKPPATRRPGY